MLLRHFTGTLEYWSRLSLAGLLEISVLPIDPFGERKPTWEVERHSTSLSCNKSMDESLQAFNVLVADDEGLVSATRWPQPEQ